jgi:hypothetical protein
MSEDTAAETPENTDVEANSDSNDLTPPESSGWWQFQSKDDAAKWANDIVEKRLARERKKVEPLVAEHATLKAEVERLKPLEDATKTDAQRWESEKQTLAQELAELREFRSKAERTNLVREIADEKGLPAQFVSRVRGNDADEIAADIDDLLNVLNDGKPRKPASPKPKEADADERGKKGHSGGGGDDDDTFDAKALAQKIRENSTQSFAR